MTAIPWNRINTGLLLAVLLAIIGLFASRAYGGPLDPPGAPASTDGVREAGTPISSLPLVISQPGRYYLTRDLTEPINANAITIQTNDVTVDLHGFTLHGTAGLGNGVFVSGARTGVRIEHGNIRGFFNGIDATNATFSRLSDVTVIGNGQASFDGSAGVLIGANSVVEDCNVSSNTALGIASYGATIRDCLVSNNGNDGVYVTGKSVMEHNHVRTNNQATGSFFDVRVVGNAVLTDNWLGRVVMDLTTTVGYGYFLSNTVCLFATLGANVNNGYFPGAPNEGANTPTLC